MRHFLILLSLFCLPHFSQAEAIDPDRLIRPDLLEQAIGALHTHAAHANSERLVVVDYSLHSSKKRLFIVNLDTGHVSAFRTAHGRGSDADHDGYLDTFSDTPGSGASPQGAFVTAEEYHGRHGRSLRLDGLDETNANARRRAIVIHAADYAEPGMIDTYGKLGRSLGCIAFSRADLTTVLADLPDNTLIFVGK